MNYYTFTGGAAEVSILADYRVNAKLICYEIFGDVHIGQITVEGNRK